MNDARILRIVAAVALVTGAVLFAFGVARERSGSESRQVSAEASPHEEGTGQGEAGEGEEHAAGSGEAAGDVESDAELFGVDLESTPFVVVAVVASAALAAALAGLRSKAVLVAAAGFAFVFAIADVREAVIHLDQDGARVAAIAAVVCVLHVATAIAALAAWRRLQRAGAPA